MITAFALVKMRRAFTDRSVIISLSQEDIVVLYFVVSGAPFLPLNESAVPERPRVE